MLAMERSTQEVEIKLRLGSASEARERLTELGASMVRPREFEDNVVFDREHDPLTSKDQVLRLREKGAAALVTLKAPVEGSHRHKVREEHETGIEDAAALTRILERLGFSPAYRYQKHRTTYDLDGLAVCLDETPIGCFVELEGRPDAIDEVAQKLGFGPGDYICESYRELQLRDARERGETAGDMLVPQRETDSKP